MKWLLVALIVIGGSTLAIIFPFLEDLMLHDTVIAQQDTGIKVSNMQLNSSEQTRETRQIELSDPTLKFELVSSGMDHPTGMAFVDSHNILIIQRNGDILLKGMDLDENGNLVGQLSVAGQGEQGLLGISAIKTGHDKQLEYEHQDKTYVFLYATKVDGDEQTVRNSVYRYEWDSENNTLTNERLLITLPANPSAINNGGKLLATAEGHLFISIGDFNREGGQLQNFGSGVVDSTSSILRVDFDGNPLSDNPFRDYDKDAIAQIYAYGIRNSFGMDIDPITGNLWITENGEYNYDEINLVPAGSNFGWKKIIGPMSKANVTEVELFFLKGAKYVDPVFSFFPSIGITDIEFFNSTELGEKYMGNVFVGDYNGGSLFFFKLNSDRTGFDLDNPLLSDNIADDFSELDLVRIAYLEPIVALETGPDGNLYILTFTGELLRLVFNEDCEYNLASNERQKDNLESAMDEIFRRFSSTSCQ